MALLTSASIALAATPIKEGATCSKAGISKNYQGKKFTCVNKGKKLIWNKGVTIKKASPIPTVNPSPNPSQTNAPTSSTSNPIQPQYAKITELAERTPLTSVFPTTIDQKKPTLSDNPQNFFSTSRRQSWREI